MTVNIGKDRFPEGFVWGSATASFQVEGAAWTDGRGESIWDRFCRTPGKVAAGHTGDIACDHYHLWKQDISLMKDLGMQAYRFSTAWPRVIPGGRGPVNKAGLDFYDRLVDGLLEAGIVPFTTLFHWDLPQALQDEGGWVNRNIVEAFGVYAEQVVKRLGDRVKHWMTHNEIPCFIGLGYGNGPHAPGLDVSRKDLNRAYHNAFLSHGLAVRIVREFARKDAEVGLVNNPLIPVPLAETPAHLDAARKAFIRIGANLNEPIFKGAYAPWWLEEQGADAPDIRDGDMEIISSPTDFLGINVYSGVFVEPSEDPAGYRVLPFPKGYPNLALPWLKPVPQALYWCCRYYREAYGIRKSYITEAGCACEDERDESGRIIDLARVQWLRDHVREAHRAVRDGLGLAGFFQWSLLDNFEWAEGYLKRFGMVYVDYGTQERIPKESAYLYKEIIRTGMIV
ncbi:MAG: beta-galactosidase [Fibrobacteres bacterium]|nr:beta-galactosidase [Fibrobacterota bacterium]